MGQPQPVATIGLAAQVPAAGLVEILDRRGRVRERIRLDGDSQMLGRAYTNDVVLDDPYVCPRHARMHIDEGNRLVVEDLDSANGVFAQREKERQKRLLVAPNETFRIGRSSLRYRHSDVPLPETLADPGAGRLESLFDKPFAVVIAILSALGFCGLDAFGTTFTEDDVLGVAAQIMAAAAVLLVWAGVWAFATRISNDRAAFLSHAGIASAALASALLAGEAAGHLLFGVDLDAATSAVSFVTMGVIATAGLYLHLRFCWNARSVKLLVTAGVISFSIISAWNVFSQLDQAEFSADPRYSGLIKSAAFKLAEADSVSEFFDRSGALTARLSSELNKKQENSK